MKNGGNHMARFKMRVAVHLFLKRNDELLLLRRFNTGYEDGNYSVIAGHVDGNETIFSAMKREALEEAGITINEDDLKIVHVMHRKDGDESIDYFLSCSHYSGDISIQESNKCDELSFYPVGGFPENIIPYIQKAFEYAQSGILFSDYGFDLLEV